VGKLKIRGMPSMGPNITPEAEISALERAFGLIEITGQGDWNDIIIRLSETHSVQSVSLYVKADILQRLIEIVDPPPNDLIAKLAMSLAEDLLARRPSGIRY
jgi:hypothetical protein